MPLRFGMPIPPLNGATEWLHGGEITPADLAGKPVLVHFWSLTCPACQATMPDVAQWADRYGPRGLLVVGVHQPRTDRDLDSEAIKHAVARHGLTHPIAIDNQHHIARTWENRFVPAFYLFDHEGKLRHYQAGTRGLKMLEQAIERVLAGASALTTGAGAGTPGSGPSAGAAGRMPLSGKDPGG